MLGRIVLLQLSIFHFFPQNGPFQNLGIMSPYVVDMDIIGLTSLKGISNSKCNENLRAKQITHINLLLCIVNLVCLKGQECCRL